MIAPSGFVGLTLSASVTPAADTVSSWFSVGVLSLIVSRPSGSLLKPSADDREIGELQPLDVP